MANITTQTIRVDLSTDKVVPSAFTHQNDTARTLVFDMFNGGMPYTMTGNTVKFAYKSPIVDGAYTVITGSGMASGTVSGNKVTVTLPSAYTQISGVGMLTMIITPTSGTVRPVNIRLVVQKSADGDDTVMGASDFPVSLYDYMDNWLEENEPTEIANLKSDLSLTNAYKKLKKNAVDSSGKLIINNGYDTECYKVYPGSEVTIELSSYNGVVVAFYVDEPFLDSVSYNASREYLTPSEAFTKTVPLNCEWITIRVNVGTGSSKVSPLYNALYDRIKTVKEQYDGDLSDLPYNTICYTSRLNQNSPFYNKTACVIETFRIVNNAKLQIATGFSSEYKGITYTRTYVGGSWTDWQTFNNSLLSRPKYMAFGDSLTKGAMWQEKSTSPFYDIVICDEKNKIPTRIANALGAHHSYTNHGVGGSTLVDVGDNTIYKKIASVDLTDVKIVTIAGGRNDSSNPLGDKLSTVDDGTICGGIKKIIEYVQSNYKKVQIVWIGVTPNTITNDNSAVFTAVTSGGWTLNSFDEKVSELCAEYCVPYVNWKGCTYMMHWADFSGAGGNYAHPNNQDSYLQMGNYIAGKVSQYYIG